MAGFLTVGNFLISLLFSLVLLVLWLRIILRYYRVSHLHPLGSAIYNMTNPVLKPLEQTVYGKDARLARRDWVGLGAIVLVEFCKFILLGLIVYKTMLPVTYLLLFVAADLIIQPCNLLFYALILRVVLSWVNPVWQRHPAADILILITAPLISWGHKIVPNISGFDFSPFVMMIILKVITLFISASMPLPLL